MHTGGEAALAAAFYRRAALLVSCKGDDPRDSSCRRLDPLHLAYPTRDHSAALAGRVGDYHEVT
jgi:hypothetical protein